VIEGGDGTKGDEGLGSSRTDGDREGSKPSNVGKFDRKRGIRERESGAGESLKIINRFDDTRIERYYLLRLALMKVSEVHGGRARRPSSAESSQECTLKSIPVVSVDATAFQGIEPSECIAAEGIKDEGHRLLGRPSRGRA
jgi:hypothetical protein